MNLLKKHLLFKLITLVLSIALLITIVGCEKSDDSNDLTPSTAIAMHFDLPVLNYAYDSLEPYIDQTTMEIHHTKHHNSYTNNFNLALEKHPELNLPIEEMLANLSLVPSDIREAIQNNGGGYFNHALYFSILKINNGQTPSGSLGIAINESFTSFNDFKEAFSTAAATHFGSGWAYLIVTSNGLEIVTTVNQDTPLNQGIPILCIDVWEHAYYLNYQNKRADYIAAFFHVINWDQVALLYEAAIV